MKDPARPRILMLLENSSYPMDVRVRREAKSLVSVAGYHVMVIAPSSPGQPQHEMIEGVRIYRYPAPPPAMSFLGYLWEYGYSMLVIFLLSLRVLMRDGFDIVHAHHPPDAFGFIGAFYRLLGKRFVLDHHDLAPELYYARFGGKGSRLVYQVLITLEEFACKVADHVITTNESYKIIEMRRSNVPEERITIVRNGPVLCDLCDTDSDPNSDLRREGRTIIGYAGVMGTQDGVDYLLRALHRVIVDLGRRDFVCILVGSGDAFPRLKSLAQQLDISDYVVFTGWLDEQPEVARYISAMDICVAPEPSDPYNDRSTAIKIMQYMAHGKPTVAFDLPEHRFTAQDAAVYARPNDELDYARQIVLLMDDPNKRKKMGKRGRERVEAELAWSHQEKHLLRAYETLNEALPERHKAVPRGKSS